MILTRRGAVTGMLTVRLRLSRPVSLIFEGTLEGGTVHLGVGPNGVGKTSFLRALMGLLPAEKGSAVLLDGKNLLQLGPRDRALRVGLLPQVEEGGMDLTVEEMVLLGRYARWSGTLPRPEDRVRVQEVLREMGLESFRHRRVSSLSGGERQWVRLARLVAQDPQVVLLDEPDQHLDDRRRQALLHLMGQWRAEGRVVFWVSHNPCGMERHADRLWRFEGGTLVPDADFRRG